MIKITDKDTIDVMFTDGERTACASITLTKLKELIMDEAMEIITKSDCNSSSCAVNGFCECDPINEDMEYAGIYFSAGKKQIDAVILSLPSDSEIETQATKETSFPKMCYPTEVMEAQCRKKFIEGARWMKSNVNS